jgi:hypothetical protein
MDTAAEVSPPRAPVGAVVPLPAAQRALLEWNPHSQLVLDADLRIRYVNQAALAFADCCSRHPHRVAVKS